MSRRKRTCPELSSRRSESPEPSPARPALLSTPQTIIAAELSFDRVGPQNHLRRHCHGPNQEDEQIGNGWITVAERTRRG